MCSCPYYTVKLIPFHPTWIEIWDIYKHCLEDDRESSRYSNMSQSMLCVSVLIAAGSFAAAFTPPGDLISKGKNADMPLFDGESYFLNYVRANSVSFYFSTFATCLLMHASLPTTPTTKRHRPYYLQLSVMLVFAAIISMLETFTNVVRLALDPQNSWGECFLFYFTLVVQRVKDICFCLPVLVLVVSACLRMRLQTSKHRRRDMFIALAGASILTTYMVITGVITFVKRVQLGKQESCSWPGCHDAIFLHPTWGSWYRSLYVLKLVAEYDIPFLS